MSFTSGEHDHLQACVPIYLMIVLLQMNTVNNKCISQVKRITIPTTTRNNCSSARYLCFAQTFITKKFENTLVRSPLSVYNWQYRQHSSIRYGHG